MTVGPGTCVDPATCTTLSDAEPDFPETVACIVADPAVTAVTVPVEETVATVGEAEAHVIGRPVRTLPAESLADALAFAEWPIASDVESSVTATTATGEMGDFTVRVAEAARLATVAWIKETPAVNAVTTPLDDTVAIDGFWDEKAAFTPTTLPSAAVATTVA
jgi:hypothetical protein